MGSSTPLSTAQLHVLIVGAGIAGLAAAAAFRKAGHKVQVFERSNFSNEVGAAVTISPNGTRVLRELGFNFKTAGGVWMQYMNLYDTVTMEKISENDMGDVEAICGAPYEAYHRADLHAELLRMAREISDPSEIPVELFRRVQITHVDAENAEIELADGTMYKGDLLIGADGLHSVVRAAAVKNDTPPIDSCWQIYRFLLPREAVMEDEVLKSMKLENGRLMWYHGNPDKGGEVTRYVWYSCRNDQVQNFAGFYLGDRDQTTVEDFGQHAGKDRVLKLFSHIHPTLVRTIEKAPADKILFWRIYEREPLSTFIYGRTLLIGDAGHPMTPFTAQGATQALEDAGALLGVFSNLSSKNQLQSRLEVYEEVRLARSARVQSSASTSLRSGKPNPLVGRKQEYLEADKMFPKELGDKEKFLWDFAYDVFRHCQKVLGERETVLNGPG